MGSINLKDMFPIEVTTHNLYFHEEASIFSIDTFNNLIATGGGDGIVRLWQINDTEIKKEGDFVYTTALNSSIQLVYKSDLVGHTKAVNCVRFSYLGILASSSDTGRVLLHFNDKTHVLRGSDELDCYELTWAKDTLYVGLSNGLIEEYQVLYDDNFYCKLVKSCFLHTDIIQGLAYNSKHFLLLSVSKDRTLKISQDDKMLDKINLNTNGRSFFRRTCFSKCNNMCFITNYKNSSILVLTYPFTEKHWIYKLGPFDSEIVKVIENNLLLFVLSKTSLYFYYNFNLLGCIENICFKSVTDATLYNNILFISSLDGFIATFKWRVEGG